MKLVLVIHCIKILINKNVEVIVFGVGNCVLSEVQRCSLGLERQYFLVGVGYNTTCCRRKAV